MKYIKKFEKFDIKKENQPLEITADMNQYNKAEIDQKEFKNAGRKNQLLQIYQTYTKDANIGNTNIAQDLFNKLKAAKFLDPKSTVINPIWINQFFKVYSEYCQQERNVKNSDETLNLKKQTIDNAQKAKSSNQGNPDVLDKDIADATAGVKEEDGKLAQTQTNVDALKKSSDKELKDKQKDFEASKKRIDSLKLPQK